MPPAAVPENLHPEVAGITPAPEPAETVEAVAATAGAPEGAQGLLGRIRENVGSTVQRVAEMESVQRATQVVTEKLQKVAESERVQQGVQFVKSKTTELLESERVQKGLDLAKDTAKAVSERTQQGIEYAKELKEKLPELKAKVWESGKGTIQRLRTEGVSALAWKGSARDTLAALEEQWKNIKVQGAEELSVPARTEHTCAYHVSKGSTLRWTFRVKDYDIGFSVRMRVQEWGGSREEEVLAMERYDNADTISGSWVADENRTMVLAFDNTYSKLRSKTVAYLVGTEKPPIFTEPAASETQPSEQRPII